MVNYKQILNSGYSLITADENKVPNLAWKKYQNEALSFEDFEKNRVKSSTKFVGLVTGFNGVEVVDVDLKVFKEKSKADEFWNEYYTLLNDNIEDFEKKFLIAKTLNNGYHIIYRCENPGGNKKIAKLQGMTEAVIETRGVGGYVIVYDADYTKIKKISDEDREIILSISEMYDFKDEVKVEQPSFNYVKKSPWADYNEKTNIWDLVSGEFEIVKKTSKATIIKRNGAKSHHSGYLYNNNRIYLFSTGTIYPAEQLLTPFSIYAYQNFNGNFSEAGKNLFYKGYGSRDENKTYKYKDGDVNPVKVSDFPVNIFPDILKTFINEVGDNANYSKDFLSVSVISAISTVLGRKIKLKVNNTWETYPIFWFAVVGNPGSKKSHPVKFALKPLKNFDIENKKKYDKELEFYETYQEADDFIKKEMRAQYGKISKPKYNQYVVKDATIEALFYVHEANPNGILLYKDELIGFIKGMGQYKGGAGEDMEQYLSLFDGSEIKKNRVTKEPLLLEETCVNLIGTIQPDVLEKIPRENGFLQRFLFTKSDNKIKRFKTNEIDQNTIDSYFNFISAIRKIVQQTREQIEYILTPQAKTEFSKVDSYFCNIQESDDCDKYLMQFIEKIKTYLPRFSLIISVLNNIEKSNPYAVVEKEDVVKAFELSKYFINTAKYLLFEQNKTKEVKEMSKKMFGLSDYEKATKLIQKGISKTKVAEELGMSRTNLYKMIEKYKV